MKARSQGCVSYHDIVGLLEAVWGDGYLSPGGPEEIALLLDGLDLSGRHVLDIGCGVGGIDVLLVACHQAAHVTGIDVDAALIARASGRAASGGLAGRLTFLAVEPGALPFEDAAFDVVFSKDAILHIPDKEALFADVLRVLRPGGLFVASDWMSRDDLPPSTAMQAYVEREGLGFGLTPMARSLTALRAAGATVVRTRDRNGWYTALAREEIDRLTGPLYADLAEQMGSAALDREVDVWRLMLVILESGELRPGHIIAQKPL